MKNFNEEKIIKVLQEAEGDIMVRNVCRKHQITEQTFYRWRNKFAAYGSENATGEFANERSWLNKSGFRAAVKDGHAKFDVAM